MDGSGYRNIGEGLIQLVQLLLLTTVVGGIALLILAGEFFFWLCHHLTLVVH